MKMPVRLSDNHIFKAVIHNGFIMDEEDVSLFSEIEDSLETLKRHISVITTLLSEQPMGIIRISQETGLPEHKIRYSLRILERDNIISPSKEGAILTPEFIADRERLVQRAKVFTDDVQEVYQQLKSILLKK